MDSGLGWIELSPKALRQLQRALEHKGEEVRDELGDQFIQKAYADRFFPGTSVQHTRIRYLFFSCWNYLQLARRGRVNKGNLERQKQKLERWVTMCLKENGGETTGVIGRRVYPRPTAVPPDAIYWTAMVIYGMYRGPSRAELHERWDGARVRATGARRRQEEPAGDSLVLFDCPPVPEGWGTDDDMVLQLALERHEAEHLFDRLSTLEPCVLARAAELARTRPPDKKANAMWSDSLIREASRSLDEHEAVIRAGRAAWLVRLARTVYAALVEQVHLDTVDHAVREAYGARANRDRLGALFVEEPQGIDTALALDLDRLAGDVPDLPASLRQLLGHVQAGARAVGQARDPHAAVARHFLDPRTCALFTQIERDRKHGRARLPRTPAGKEHRRGLGPDTLNVSALHYRWNTVKQMLWDLHQGLSR